MSDPWSQSGPSWSKWAGQIDPQGLRYTPWQDYSSDQFSYNIPFRGGEEYDPAPRGDTYAPYSSMTQAQIGAGIDAYNAEYVPSWMQEGQQSGANSGQVGNPATPEWAKVNGWNDAISAAIQKVYTDTGVYVPPNVVKAIMKIESQGDPNAGPAYGLLQVTSGAMGQYDLARARADPAYGIWAGVNDLALRYNDSPGKSWDQAIVGFFSGHYVPIGSKDEFNTDYNYLKMFQDNMKVLNGTGVGGQQAAPNTKTFNSIWGGYDAPASQGFGYEDCVGEYVDTCYAKTSGGLYNYGAVYTTNGQPMGHPGVDAAVVAGTPLYAPVDGTVICGGTGFGNGQDQCLAYTADKGSRQSGRFQLMLANGDMLILGHMQDISVQPGQVLKAGDYVGKSGGQKGDHVHVEYRQYAPNAANYEGYSGYLQVDPRLALAGMFTGTFGTAPTDASGRPLGSPATTADFPSFMRGVAQGMPIAGEAAPGAGGFHDYLRKGMQGIFPGDIEENPPAGWLWGYEAPPTSTPPIG